jgi:hypothetical protein
MKITVSFVMSVRMVQSDSHWGDFSEILYLDLLSKSAIVFRFCLLSYKYDRQFTCKSINVYNWSGR